MIGSFLLLVASFFSHTGAARVLPGSWKLLAPSLGWFFTSVAIHSRFSHVDVVFHSVLGAGSALSFAKVGTSCELARRALYFPFLTGLLGGGVGTLLGRSGWRVNIVAAVFVVVLQLWATAGGVVMLAVFPASVVQVIEPQEAREARFRNAARFLSSQMGKTVERSVTASINGMHLDTVIVKPTRGTTSKWMVYFGGNAEFLENTLADVSREADTFHANLVLFNSRGMGRSNGYVSQVSDLVEDAAAVTQYVVKKEHIDPRMLLIFGHSIGGGIGAQLAYRVFPEATLLLDRTFSSLADAASSFSPFTPAVTQFLFPLLVGDLNSVEAWNGLQHDRRLILFSRADEMISFAEASIARLPQFQTRQPDSKYVVELHGPTSNVHNVPIGDFEERSAISAYVKRCLGA